MGLGNILIGKDAMTTKKRGKLQIGIVGGGMIAQAHMNNFRDDHRTEIRWLAEIDKAALGTVAKEYAVPRQTVDYREMLADKELDAVVTCTPPSSHCRIGIDTLRAKKHLMMEKPLARTVTEAKRLLREVHKHPELMVTGCSCRHARLNPKFKHVKQLIESGKLGEIYFIHHRVVGRQERPGIEYHPTAKWFLDRELAGGGPLWDWGVYDLSFHLGVLDQPQLERVEAFCVNGLDQVNPGTSRFTVEEHGGAMMHFTNGLKYFWERAANAHLQVPNQTCIYGTKGGIRFDYTSWGSNEIEFFYVGKAGHGKPRSRILKVHMANHNRGDMYPLGQAFIKGVQKRGPAPMPLDIEVKNLEILNKIYKAANW